MKIRKFAPLLVAGALFLQPGCTANPLKGFFNTMNRLQPPEERHPSDDSDEEWDFVGEEANKIRPTEKDPDPWWQDYIMSEKARSIEHSLGVE